MKIDSKDDWSMIIKSFFKIECNWIWSAFLQRSRGVTKNFSQASPKKQNVVWTEPLAHRSQGRNGRQGSLVQTHHYSIKAKPPVVPCSVSWNHFPKQLFWIFTLIQQGYLVLLWISCTEKFVDNPKQCFASSQNLKLLYGEVDSMKPI